jgi:Na+/H+-translocating membrane pyrophosphatase
MTQEVHPILSLSDNAADSLLQRALRITLILGVLAALALWIGSGWRNAAMFATGALISAASIWEWQRLARLVYAKMDNRKTPMSAPVVVIFSVLRLIVFAGAIYGSLKCFRGSVIALLCGLGLAVLALVWEALRLLKN